MHNKDVTDPSVSIVSPLFKDTVAAYSIQSILARHAFIRGIFRTKAVTDITYAELRVF